jgi:hypothetical protein
MARERRAWRQVKLLLEPADEQRLSDAAHAARLPLGAFIREFLLTGHPPEPAPPAPADLSPEADSLLRICHGLISNLSQCEAHAERIGGPLARLCGNDGALQQMAEQARTLALKIKCGELDERTITDALVVLEPAAHDLNDQLAHPLNQTQVVSLDTWRQVLVRLQSALQISKVKP